jgi:hypothetical protein
MYWLGDLRAIEKSDSLCNSFSDMLINEVILQRPMYISGFALDEETNSLSMVMTRMKDELVYGNKNFPDNISTLFKTIHTVPSWFTKKMIKCLDSKPKVIDF